MGVMTSNVGGGLTLHAEQLTAEAFRPFGDVVDRRALGPTLAINGGTAQRLHDLTRIDVARGGHAAISVVRAQARTLPFRIECMERHLRGSQAWLPLGGARWIVVVSAPGRRPAGPSLRAFVASDVQGVNYRRGTWHHPLVALGADAEFLVVDRVADDGGEDCEVVDFAAQDVRVVVA